jgi:elongation factor 1-beta
MADELEKTLANQQWVGGQTPTNADNDAYTKMLAADLRADTHPNTFAWFTLCYKFSEAVRGSWTAAAAAGGKGGKGKGGKGGKKETKKADDDDMDLFGDDDEDDAAAAKAAAAAAAAKGKKKKEKPPEMSLIIFEVKPLDDTTNLDDLAQTIFAMK